MSVLEAVTILQNVTSLDRKIEGAEVVLSASAMPRAAQPMELGIVGQALLPVRASPAS